MHNKQHFFLPILTFSKYYISYQNSFDREFLEDFVVISSESDYDSDSDHEETTD